MLLRIADAFDDEIVPERLRAILYAAPLRSYARNTWHGGLYRGEKRAPILQTNGTDTISECLAFTVLHLVVRVADSGIRDFDVISDSTAERETSRLGATFATRLIEAFARGIVANREDFEFKQTMATLGATVDSFRIVSQVMYPTISETRQALLNYDHDDPSMIWIRAIDHALFLPTERLPAPDPEGVDKLVRFLDATIDAFYPFFLSKIFGETVYEFFEAE